MSRQWILNGQIIEARKLQIQNLKVPHYIFYRHDNLVVRPIKEGDRDTLTELNRGLKGWKMIDEPIPASVMIEEIAEFVQRKLSEAGWTTRYD